jgi:hypothetical protein
MPAPARLPIKPLRGPVTKLIKGTHCNRDKMLYTIAHNSA